MTRLSPTSTLFPYTTLFRSPARARGRYGRRTVRFELAARSAAAHAAGPCSDPSRSEEHTSELQSHVNLVCRLLLEKKKTKTANNVIPCRAASLSNVKRSTTP